MGLSERLTEKTGILISLFICFLFFVVLSVNSEATFDSGDGIRHYLISRYSWNHPHLFLDSWGKPFFTFITSPFSQFGFPGITIFNILCGILSAWLTYRVAQKQNYRNAFLVIPFLLFAPVYFPTMNSGLTEPFFGLMLIAAIYLMFEKKYLTAGIAASLLPFVRSEGFILLPLFFLLLIFYRSYLAALLLFSGTLFYSILGRIVWGDFFWISNQNPYTNGEVYGRGGPFSFIERHDFIWGPALGVLFLLGLVCIISRMFPYKNKPEERRGIASIINVETVLILGSFLIYFCAHSFLWWKGIGNSMGLLRVLAAVMPCSALICVRGFNLVLPDILFRNPLVKYSIFTVLLSFVLLKPFRANYFPFKPTVEQVVVKEAADWMKQEGHDKQKIYYLYPYLPLVLNADAFDTIKTAELWGLYDGIKKKGYPSIPDSTIVFWDAHFGPNECGIPLEKMMNDPNFDLLKSFHPEEAFSTLGGHPFTVNIFMKRSSPKKAVPLKKLAEFDFPLNGNSDVLNANTEFGNTLYKKTGDFPKGIQKIKFNAQLLSQGNVNDSALLVLSIDNEKSVNSFWNAQPLMISTDSTGAKNVSAEFNLILDSFQEKDVLKIYIWNSKKKDFVFLENKMECWGN